jgi:hypothetical protein
MARTIQSPGVEIREIDLSLSPSLPIGTNIFVAGFANKGPTDEILQITSTQEFEQVYGTPTNAAERYFYYSARQILNGSSGNLFVNRLPYGNGNGEGYGSTYGALVYPVVSITESLTSNVYRNVEYITSDCFSVFNGTEINIINGSPYLASIFPNLSTNGINYYGKFSEADGTILINALTNASQRISGVNATLSNKINLLLNSFSLGKNTHVSNLLDVASGTLLLGAPKFFELTSDQYRSVLDKSAFTNSNYSWSNTGRNVYANPADITEAVINGPQDFGYAGLIVINKIQSTVNTKYEGHYIGITDNYNIEPNSPHVSISSVYSNGMTAPTNGFIMTGSNGNPSYKVPTSKLSFPLQSTNQLGGARSNNSVSEALERIGYAFADVSTNKFADTLCLGVFKLRVSPYTTDALQLDYVLEESHLGSVDSYRLLNNQAGGIAKSFFLENTASTSNDVVIMVNDYVSLKNGSMSNLDNDGIPKRKIRVLSNSKINDLIVNKENYYKNIGFHLNDLSLLPDNTVDSTMGANMKLKATTTIGSAASGQSNIVVTSDSNWAVGDTVTVSYTGDPSKDQTTTIASLNGTTVTLTDNLVYNRSGGTIVTNKSSYRKVYFQPADGLYSDGAYSGDAAASKVVGNIPLKLDRTLRKIENDEIFDLDLVLEGGLGTINASICANEVGYFNDTQYSNGIMEGLLAINRNDVSNVSKPAYDLTANYNTIFNLFENFASKIRKDCLFVSDPLRHIFVTGVNTTTMSDPNKAFSQYIYNPLKHLFENANSSYACTYGNWVKIIDLFTGAPVWLPMSGYIAADIANVDKNFEPWYAPAGFTRGKITNVLALAITPNLKERDMLYKIGVNPVAFFPNDGFNIFGQKTMLRQPSAFDRINVRRLFLYLEKATKKTTKYFIMEPNTVYTRSRVVATLDPIFSKAKNTQGLYDYQIICDIRNNTASVIDQNEMVVDIYLKPVRSAEFILVNFYATSTGTNFNEIIG